MAMIVIRFFEKYTHTRTHHALYVLKEYTLCKIIIIISMKAPLNDKSNVIKTFFCLPFYMYIYLYILRHLKYHFKLSIKLPIYFIFNPL